MKKVELDDTTIIREYTENKKGVHEIAEQFHTAPRRVRQILLSQGITINRHNKAIPNVISDPTIRKYPQHEGKKYIVFDPLTNFESSDINNKSGALTSYIHQQYGVEVPTNALRNSYYKKTGNYWWEQWLQVREEENTPKVTKRERWKTVDWKAIADEYQNSSTPIHEIAAKYGIGTKRVRDTLSEMGIPVRSKRNNATLTERYNNGEHKTLKYQPSSDTKKLVVYDPNTDFVSNDVENLSGALTAYIASTYNVEVPSIFLRHMYYLRTGNYWWEQWLQVREEDIVQVETKKCPYCDWQTNDIRNSGGWFGQHLRSVHGLSIQEHLKIYPEDIDFFKYANETRNVEFETDTNNYLVCAICGRKFRQLAQHLLLTHGLTKSQYIEQYGETLFTCQASHEKQSIASKLNNANGNHVFTKHSTAEKEIIDFINKLGVSCQSDRHILDGQEIDILIPDFGIGIEYNGNIWHTEDQHPDHRYHLNKTILAFSKGIYLIHIFEDEYHLHKDIVLSKIRHILHKDSTLPAIDGRKCQIREIQMSMALDFLNENHIQGGVGATVYLGAFHKDQLVAVMSFLNEGKDVWNLNRSCSDIHYRCRGISGKLFKYFTEHYQSRYRVIKSFLDRRWCACETKNIYTQLGFTFDGYIGPDYRYYNSNVDRYQRFHKFGFRKDKLLKKYPEVLNKDMTEREMTTALGYSRIWDCGLIRYIYKNPIDK